MGQILTDGELVAVGDKDPFGHAGGPGRIEQQEGIVQRLGYQAFIRRIVIQDGLQRPFRHGFPVVDPGHYLDHHRFVPGPSPTFGEFGHILTAHKSNLGFRVFQDIGDFRPFEHIVDGPCNSPEFLGPEHGIIDFRGIEHHDRDRVSLGHTFRPEVVGDPIGPFVDLAVSDHLVIIENVKAIGRLLSPVGQHLGYAVKMFSFSFQGRQILKSNRRSDIPFAFIYHRSSPFDSSPDTGRQQNDRSRLKL